MSYYAIHLFPTLLSPCQIIILLVVPNIQPSCHLALVHALTFGLQTHASSLGFTALPAPHLIVCAHLTLVLDTSSGYRFLDYIFTILDLLFEL